MRWIVDTDRELLFQLPFDCDYGVEIGMLIDVWTRVGLEGMAEVDLGTRQNRHRELAELTPMAATVLQSVVARLQAEGRLTDADRQELADADKTFENGVAYDDALQAAVRCLL